MKKIQQVLLITNLLADDDQAVIEQAAELNKKANIKLNLLTVCPSIPACYFQLPSMAEVHSLVYSDAANKLAHLGEKLNVVPADQHIATGSLHYEISRMIEELRIDLLLTGGNEGYVLHRPFNDILESIIVRRRLSAHLAQWVKQSYQQLQHFASSRRRRLS